IANLEAQEVGHLGADRIPVGLTGLAEISNEIVQVKHDARVGLAAQAKTEAPKRAVERTEAVLGDRRIQLAVIRGGCLAEDHKGDIGFVARLQLVEPAGDKPTRVALSRGLYGTALEAGREILPILNGVANSALRARGETKARKGGQNEQGPHNVSFNERKIVM